MGEHKEHMKPRMLPLSAEIAEKNRAVYPSILKKSTKQEKRILYWHVKLFFLAETNNKTGVVTN